MKTYAAWKRKVKSVAIGKVIFDGDKDICCAFEMIEGMRILYGEWDGEKGEVYVRGKTNKK